MWLFKSADAFWLSNVGLNHLVSIADSLVVSVREPEQSHTYQMHFYAVLIKLRFPLTAEFGCIIMYEFGCIILLLNELSIRK